ncbi:MAG: TldD/PmbA family protein [Dehalococcoidia bacterium]
MAAIPSKLELAAVAERILEKALEAGEEAEVFYMESTSTPVHFEANAIKAVDSNETAGAALRLIKNGRVGFSSTSNLDDVDGLVKAAVETAPFGAEARFQFPGPSSYPDVPVHDASVMGVPLERMTQLGQQVIDALRAYSQEVQVEGSVSRSASTISLMNSRGGRYSYDRSGFGLGFEGTVIRGEDMLFTYDGVSSVHPVDDATEVIESIIRQLQWARETASITTKEMPVILMPTAVSSVLLSPLLAGFSGRTVLQGTSPMAGRLGETIVDTRFSLIDDTTLPYVGGSRPADDEGVASRRLPIIERGVAASFLYDLQTAGLAGTESTGSGERGLGSLPSPSSGVLFVSEGDATLSDMIADISEGLIVERLLGAGQSNILGGDFNANVLLGYKIENGKVVGRVKDAMVSGNAYESLNNLVALGSEGRWLGGGLYTPPITLANVAVSAK